MSHDSESTISHGPASPSSTDNPLSVSRKLRDVAGDALNERKSKALISSVWLKKIRCLDACRWEEEELQAFYQVFRAKALRVLMPSGQNGYVIDNQGFLTLFPEFMDCRRLVKAILSLFDYELSPKTAQVSRHLTFEQFVVITSTIARGTQKEKAELVARLCESKEVKRIRWKKVRSITHEIHTALHRLSFRIDFSLSMKDEIKRVFEKNDEPIQTIDNSQSLETALNAAVFDEDVAHMKMKDVKGAIIAKKEETKLKMKAKIEQTDLYSIHKSLGREEFISRILNESVFLDCFGLFPYLGHRLIKPLLKTLYVEKSMEGKTGLGFPSLQKSSVPFANLGFLTIQRRGSLCWEEG
eukprot:TRINITY_DN5253_c0_g3_i3.p1 TRINITY_DN5253_c0_g3~~TRINITY_DN5253_c0_g3_i3.p1  ORF type:complete len:397 (-),score=87.01 TRINITY_DN5253_c0_g3_i3:662-1726(-)